MQIRRFQEASQAGRAAATIIAGHVISKPNTVLGLATGSTPIPVYQEMIRLCKEGIVDFSASATFNLDEYCQLPVEHECSYHRFMAEQLFDHINIKKENIHLPNGNATSMEEEGRRYDAAIQQAGGVDVQLLGIGHNAHIGFNEPDSQFAFATHVTALTQSTIEANRRFFESEADVPRQAITMGIGSIMKAKTVLLVATGKDKAQAVYNTLRGEVNPQVPASVLQMHPNVIFLLDEGAASML